MSGKLAQVCGQHNGPKSLLAYVDVYTDAYLINTYTSTDTIYMYIPHVNYIISGYACLRFVYYKYLLVNTYIHTYK